MVPLATRWQTYAEAVQASKAPPMPASLADQLLHRISGYIRQPEIPSLEAIGELRVVDAHLIEDRGVNVMDVNGVADDVVA